MSVAVPALALLALGRPELTIYAVFGAFTAMYGRSRSSFQRLRHQIRAAALLLGGVSIGVLFSVVHIDSWSLVVAEAVLAGLGSVYADRAGLRPAGPFFGLFALGACASVPLNVAPLLAVLVATASAAFSLTITVLVSLRPARPPHSADVAPPRRAVVMNAVEYTVAVGVAGALSTAVGLGHPIWAMAAAAVPLAVGGVHNRIQRGTHRILGTLTGVVLAGVILLPFGPLPSAALVVLVVALQFPTELFMTRNYGLALVFFTPLILLMTELAHPTDSLALLRDRAAETTLGALVGIAVALTAYGHAAWSRPRYRS